jgi:hypothetical protein
MTHVAIMALSATVSFAHSLSVLRSFANELHRPTVKVDTEQGKAEFPWRHVAAFYRSIYSLHGLSILTGVYRINYWVS